MTEATESSARRRLESIARHLTSASPLASQSLLHRNPLGFDESSRVSGSYPVVIGGMVLDILAKPYTDPLPGTTTPGEVQYVAGGVARNIAECMTKLGAKPFMISVVGHDMAGELLLKYWNTSGLPTQGILHLKNVITPVVCNIFDSTRELAAAVASVEAVEMLLTPDFIKQFQSHICCAPVLILDANLCTETIEAACQIAKGADVPVWFEPVSVTKSRRIATVVDHITFASPNANELIAMADALSPGKGFKLVGYESTRVQSVESLFQILKPAICLLLEKGIKFLLVTLGSSGVFACFREWPKLKNGHPKKTFTLGNQLYEVGDRSSSKQWPSIKTQERSCGYYAYHFPALDASVVSLTGAGDCLVGGVLASISSGLDIMESIAVGISVAKAAVEAEQNVPLKISLINIADEAKLILSRVNPLHLE